VRGALLVLVLCCGSAAADPWFNLTAGGGLGAAHASGKTRFFWGGNLTFDVLFGREPVILPVVAGSHNGYGDDPRDDTSLPFRIGPFVTLEALRTKGAPGALRLAGGASVVVWSRISSRIDADLTESRKRIWFLLLSAGPAYDISSEGANRWAGFARFSLSAHPFVHKHARMALTLELAYLPAAHGEGASQEVLVGAELNPVLIAYVLGAFVGADR
jgi:hypothetical protein